MSERIAIDRFRRARRGTLFAACLVLPALGLAAQGGELIDPTRPADWRESAQPQDAALDQPAVPLRVQGTFSSAGQRSAMISGQRVVVGDLVGGAEVVEINKNNVVVVIDGKTVELASVLPAVKAPAETRRGTR